MDQKLLKKARKRVEEKKGFYGHLSVYLAMGVFFFTMNVLNWDGEFWFYFPLMPWGVGLLIHYFSVFGLPFNKILSADWEEQQMAREIRQLEKTSKTSRTVSSDERLDLKELNRQKAQGWKDEDLV